ncbi:hypothetical protein MST27_22090, partial [Pseudomonas sp. PS1]
LHQPPCLQLILDLQKKGTDLFSLSPLARISVTPSSLLPTGFALHSEPLDSLCSPFAARPWEPEWQPPFDLPAVSSQSLPTPGTTWLLAKSRPGSLAANKTSPARGTPSYAVHA